MPVRFYNIHQVLLQISALYKLYGIYVYCTISAMSRSLAKIIFKLKTKNEKQNICTHFQFFRFRVHSVRLLGLKPSVKAIK